VAVAVRARSQKPSIIRVKTIRQWLGLTQNEFARVVGVSRATVIRWEEANSGPMAASAAGRVLYILVETQRLASRVFQGPGSAQEWLRTQIPALHGTPVHTLVTRGPLPVRDILLAAVDGVPS